MYILFYVTVFLIYKIYQKGAEFPYTVFTDDIMTHYNEKHLVVNDKTNVSVSGLECCTGQFTITLS